MALFRSLFFLLTWPEGVFQCDWTDWWPHPPPVTDLVYNVCGQLYGSRNSGNVSNYFHFVSPCSLLSFKERSLNSVSYFISLCLIDNRSWVLISAATSLSWLLVTVSGHLAWANLCCRLTLAGLPQLPIGHCLHFFSTELCILERFSTFLFWLMIRCYIGVSVH